MWYRRNCARALLATSFLGISLGGCFKAPGLLDGDSAPLMMLLFLHTQEFVFEGACDRSQVHGKRTCSEYVTRRLSLGTSQRACETSSGATWTSACPTPVLGSCKYGRTVDSYYNGSGGMTAGEAETLCTGSTYGGTWSTSKQTP